MRSTQTSRSCVFLDGTANKVYILSMASGNFISDSPSEHTKTHTKKPNTNLDNRKHL